MDIVVIILLIFFLSKLTKKLRGQEVQTTQNQYQSEYSMKRQEQRQRAMENIEKAKQRAKRVISEIEEIAEIQEEYPNEDASRIFLERKAKQKKSSAMQQVYEGKREAENTSILQRAKANAREYEEDVTLTSMEREHNHLERVLSANHYHLEDDFSGDILGKLEDIMVKGYEGRLCFERDFVGEGMDMINRFTVSTDVPSNLNM